MLYPQYAWGVTTPVGNFSGYGFIEVAPYEPLSTNHLVVYTPKQAEWFSVHTETGGLPDKGLSFFQIGPRLNVTEVVPKLKRPMRYLFVAALPRLDGIRPNNVLLSGATNRFKLTSSVLGSIEGDRRFFPSHHDYTECWFLIYPKATPRLSWSVFVLSDGSRVSVGVGARISIF